MRAKKTGKYRIGVDIGGTNVRAAAVDVTGKILGEARSDTLADQGPKIVTQQISQTIIDAIAKAGAQTVDIVGAGCGMPGRIDANGIVLWSPNFPGIEGFPLVSEISDHVDLPVWMENDVNVAALGEFEFGAGRDVKSLIMLTLGTGIGGGIILNGQLWSGFNAGAAEIGHTVVNPGGRKCGCGNHGCLEAMAQRDAIIERAARKIQQGIKSSLATEVDFQVDKITPALVSKHAASGDQVSIDTLAETGHWVGIGIANMINVLNPEMVIIGGGISKAGAFLWEPMLRSVYAYAIHESRVVCKIVAAELGDNAGIMGGAALIQ